ncbi:MAG: dTMP kinase [Desulfovibrionales bacterium]
MFITFEGIEGCGKSTQCTLLKEILENQGRKVLLTREPGGSRLGQVLRTILLDIANQDLTGEAELFLYLADRSQHVSQVIRPALDAGTVVISDRYADSTVVYQGYGRGLDPKLLHTFNDVAVSGLWPDLTLLLDLPVEQGLKRALTRNFQEGQTESEGRFEAESMSFHGRVREGYLTWAALNRDRIRIVDGTGSPEMVFERVLKQTADFFGLAL